MKVKEIIEKLSEYDDNTEVLIYHNDRRGECFIPIDHISSCKSWSGNVEIVLMPIEG